MLKILIDATPLLKNLTGVGQVTYFYSKGLSARCDTTFFYAWFFSSELRERPLQGMEEKINLLKKYIPRPYFLTHLVKTIIFNICIFIKQPDVILQPNYNTMKMYKKIPIITIVHDLSHIRHPEYHPSDRIEYFEKHFLKSIASSTKLIAISQFTKDEMLDLNLAKSEKIEVVYNGISDSYTSLVDAPAERLFLRKYDLNKKKYFLYVGTLEPRKNILLLLRAYSLYQSSVDNPLDLVLIGIQGWHIEHLEEQASVLELDTVKRLGYLRDDELKMAYANALVFVFPSFYEGCGLPPIEAMASGTAVIASNCSSMPEMLGDASILIDPCDANALCSAMRELEDNEILRQDLECKGFLQSKHFRWDSSVNRLLNIIHAMVK